MKEEDTDYIHRHCFGPHWMRIAYGASSDFEVCDADGTPNPNGDYYRSIARERVKRLRGQCSFEFLPNGDRDPNWAGCPRLAVAEDLTRLDRIIKENA